MRISIKYFSKGFHYEMIKDSYIGKYLLKNTEKANLWAIFWGIKASWLFGAIVGIFIVLASRIGENPRLGMKKFFINQLIFLMLITILMFYKFYTIEEPNEYKTSGFRQFFAKHEYKLNKNGVKNWSDQTCKNYMFDSELHDAIYKFSVGIIIFLVYISVFQRFGYIHKQVFF